MARDAPLPLAVRGDCMAPALREGDRVEIVRARLYWPGDVVAFANAEDRLVLHRLLGYRLAAGRLACVTRGDGCAAADPPLPFSRLLGKTAEAPALGARLRAFGALLAVLAQGAARRVRRRRRE